MLNLGKKVILYSSRKYAYFQINCRVFAELGLKIMSKVALVKAALILSIISTSSFAANAEKKLKAKIAPVASVTEVTKSPNVTATHNWTGPYVGLNVGYAFNGIAVKNGSNFTSLIAGVAGGGQAGYDFQSGNSVIGIVADVGYSDANYTAGDTSGTKFTEPYNGSLRIRAGYLINDETLAYLTGGYSVNRQTINPTVYSNIVWKVLSGYTVGGGLERLITSNVSVFSEYRYSNYNAETYDFGGITATGGYNQSEIRVGLNFRF